MNYHRTHTNPKWIQKELSNKWIKCYIESIDRKSKFISISNKNTIHLLNIVEVYYEFDKEGEYFELGIMYEDELYECIMLDLDHIQILCEQ